MSKNLSFYTTVLSVVIAVFLVHTPISLAYGYNQPLESTAMNTALENARNNTVKVKVQGDMDSLGTGWVVKPGYVLTNAHVVENKYTGTGNVSIRFYTDSDKSTNYVKATLLAVDALHDIALLEYRHKPSNPKGIELADKVYVGAQMISVGNPVVEQDDSGADTIYTNPTILDFAYTTGAFVGEQLRLWEVPQVSNVPTMVIDMFSSQGNSGGPIVNESGQVTGMVRGYLDTKHRMSLGVPLNDIKTFLDTNLPRIATVVNTSF